MTNNELFKNFLHLTGCGKDKDNLIYIFRLGGIVASNSKIKGWRTDLDNNRASHMPDEVFQGFITGLFEYRDMQLQQGINLFDSPCNK